jgi:hypothetical protein
MRNMTYVRTLVCRCVVYIRYIMIYLKGGREGRRKGAVRTVEKAKHLYNKRMKCTFSKRIKSYFEK